MTREARMLFLMLLGSILGAPAAQAQEGGLASYEATYKLTLGDIDYDGASSAIDFSEAGDVSPTFGVYQVEKGQLPLKYTLRP